MEGDALTGADMEVMAVTGVGTTLLRKTYRPNQLRLFPAA